jgi:hypothetical protein
MGIFLQVYFCVQGMGLKPLAGISIFHVEANQERKDTPFVSTGKLGFIEEKLDEPVGDLQEIVGILYPVTDNRLCCYCIC